MRLRNFAPLILLFSQTSHANSEPDLAPRYDILAMDADWEPMSREELQRMYVQKNDSEFREEHVTECDRCNEAPNKPEFVFDKGNALVLRAVSE